MLHHKFSCWERWIDRNHALGIKSPGVYAIAVSDSNIAREKFSWREEIEYVGMTNSASGLKGRLKQFDNTISGKRGHGGADRVRFEYRNYDKLVPKLHVAIHPFECDPTSNKPKDLQKMGEVVKFEYTCLAHYVEKFKKLPKFNDKKNSPKFSKTIGKRNRKEPS